MASPCNSTASAAARVIVATMIVRMYPKKQNWKLESERDMGKTGPTEVQKANGLRYMLWRMLGKGFRGGCSVLGSKGTRIIYLQNWVFSSKQEYKPYICIIHNAG